MYHGIDYARGLANRDPATGIRYGVIPMNALADWAWDNFEADYGDPTCPDCGDELAQYETEKHEDYEDGPSDYACERCETTVSSDAAYGDSPLGHDLDGDGYRVHVGGDDSDAFVILSPYYTHAAFCSPCAPGACYLLEPTDAQGPKAYCFGHDWFEGGVAPYPVYSVATGELVEPEGT